MKKGLVLEGGSFRGIFSAGVIDVLMEHGITFDEAVGVSAGAAFGCNYKSKQIGRALRYSMKYCNDTRYRSFLSWFKTGNLYTPDFCYGEVPTLLDPYNMEASNANPMSFYTVCTDIETGETLYKEFTDDLQYNLRLIRASTALPLAAEIVQIGGKKLMDGGLSDSIPLHFMERMSCQKIVLILTQPQGFIKKKTSLLPFIHLKYHRYPKLIKLMEERHLKYNKILAYIEQKEKQGKLFVIRPPYALPISSMENNPQKIEHVYNIGRRTAIDLIDSLKQYLS